MTAVLTICTNLEVMRGLVGRYLQFKKEPDLNKQKITSKRNSTYLFEKLVVCLFNQYLK